MIEMFLAPLPMVYTIHKAFALREYVLMLINSTTETKFDCKLLKHGYGYH